MSDELPGVEEDEVGTSDEQPYDDYARRVETGHAAHEGSCGRCYGPRGLSKPLCHETEDLAALQAARRPVLPGRGIEAGGGIEGRPAVAGEVDLDPGVGVRSPDIVVAGERVVLAGGVARRHPGRYPQGAGHHGGRGTELLAVAALLLEEEVFDGVHLLVLGRDGEIVRIGLLEVLVHPQHGVVRVGRTLGQLAGERAGAFEAGGGKLCIPVRCLFGIGRACGPELVGGGVRDAGDDRVRRALGDLVRRPEGGVRVDLDGARRAEDRPGTVGAEDDVRGVLLDTKDLGDLPDRPLSWLGVGGGERVEAHVVRDELLRGITGRDLPPLPVVIVKGDPAVGHSLLTSHLHHDFIGEPPTAAEVHVRLEAVVRVGQDSLRGPCEGVAARRLVVRVLNAAGEVLPNVSESRSRHHRQVHRLTLRQEGEADQTDRNDGEETWHDGADHEAPASRRLQSGPLAGFGEVHLGHGPHGAEQEGQHEQAVPQVRREDGAYGGQDQGAHQRVREVLAGRQVEGVYDLHPEEEPGERHPRVIERGQHLPEEHRERSQGAEREHHLDEDVPLSPPQVADHERDDRQERYEDAGHGAEVPARQDGGLPNQYGGEHPCPQLDRVLGPAFRAPWKFDLWPTERHQILHGSATSAPSRATLRPLASTPCMNSCSSPCDIHGPGPANSRHDTSTTARTSEAPGDPDGPVSLAVSGLFVEGRISTLAPPVAGGLDARRPAHQVRMLSRVDSSGNGAFSGPASDLTSLPSPRAYRSSDAPAETTISLASGGIPASRLIASTKGGCASWASSMTASFPEGRPRALLFQATRRAGSPGR